MGRQLMVLLALAGGGFVHAGTQTTDAREPDAWTPTLVVENAPPRIECDATPDEIAPPIHPRTHDDCVDVDAHDIDARTRVDGSMHSLAVTHDGRLFAWGDNGEGQLGTGAIGGHFHRPQRVGGRWRSEPGAIAAGVRHSVAIRDDGTVATWGHDGCDGSSRGAGLPRTVVFADGTPLSDVIAVEAGLDESYAVTRDGSVWRWGPAGNPLVAQRLAAR